MIYKTTTTMLKEKTNRFFKPFQIYTPISGKIANVNKNLEDVPETVNESPYDEGWLVEIEISDESEIDELLDAGSL